MAEREYKNLSFRYYVNFALILIAVQGMTWLIRAVAFSGIFSEAQAMGELSLGRTILIIYSIVCVIGFSAWRAVSMSRDGAARRAYLDMSADHLPNVKELLQIDLKKDLVELAVYAGLQIPFLIFYSAFGYRYVGGIFFEGLYTMHAGIYEITRIGIIGILMDCALYFVTVKLFRLPVYRTWERERITHVHRS